MEFYQLLFLFTTLLFILLQITSSRRLTSLQCIDDDHRNVDWYFVYKFPRLNRKDHKIFDGHRYASITFRQPNGWRLSSNRIDDPDKSIFANTLAGFYDKQQQQKNNSKDKNKISYMFYNDQFENIEKDNDNFKSKCFDCEEEEAKNMEIEAETDQEIYINLTHFNETKLFASSGFAHAKGLLVNDNRKGFWLIHTVPQFAPSHKVRFWIDLI